MGKWAQIIAIWALVAVATGILLVTIPGVEVEAAFGAVLAGSIALLSLLQLFSQSAEGFVRRCLFHRTLARNRRDHLRSA